LGARLCGLPLMQAAIGDCLVHGAARRSSRQCVYRTGLSKVDIPGAPVGMNEKIVTIAACLKNQGYANGQSGKNHLGDLNAMLPTNTASTSTRGGVKSTSRKSRTPGGFATPSWRSSGRV
jgi:arylsulfatase A-like enzyme